MRRHPEPSCETARDAARPWPCWRAAALALLLAGTPLLADDAPAAGASAGAASTVSGAPLPRRPSADELRASAVRKGPAPKKDQGLWSRLNPFDDAGKGKRGKKRPQPPAPPHDSLMRKIERKVKGVTLVEPGATPPEPRPIELKPERTLTEEEIAARRQKARELEERLEREQARVRAADRDFSAAEVPFLASVGADPLNPSAPEATLALGRRQGAACDAALLRILHEGAAEPQLLALRALVARRHPEAAAEARARLSAPDARLRQAAVLAAGELRDRKAAPELRKMLAASQPGLGVCAAAALLRIDQGEDARGYLERTVETGAPQIAAQALSFLGMLGDARVAGLCFASLGRPNPQVAVTAAKVLHRLPESVARPVLIGMPDDARALAAARWRVTDYLAAPLPGPDGQGATPAGEADAALRAACKTLLDAGGADDLEKVMTCWRKRPEAGQLPLLIMLMTDPQATLAQRDQAMFMISDFLDKAGDDYAPPPEDRRDAGAWEKWWFRQHRLLAVAPGQALLQRPNGDTETVALHDALDFSARVRAIVPGPEGATALAGARVAIVCNGREYLILP